RWGWGDLRLGPPACLVAVAVQLIVMGPAKRHREFVAELSPKGARPGNLQKVGIGGACLADQARPRGDESKVRLAALAYRPVRDPIGIRAGFTISRAFVSARVAGDQPVL